MFAIYSRSRKHSNPADPLSRMQQLYGLEGDRAVASWEILLDSKEKLADAVIVATQDKVERGEL